MHSNRSLFFHLALTSTCLLALASCNARKDEIRTYKFGESAKAGVLLYTAFDTQWLPVLGEGDSKRTPGSQFMLVRLTVVNGGGDELPVPSISLVDDGGQIYGELGNGDQVPDWLGIVRKVKPGGTEQGHVVFDVPPAHYRLRVSSPDEQKLAYIDVPLNFSPDTLANQPGEKK